MEIEHDDRDRRRKNVKIQKKKRFLNFWIFTWELNNKNISMKRKF